MRSLNAKQFEMIAAVLKKQSARACLPRAEVAQFRIDAGKDGRQALDDLRALQLLNEGSDGYHLTVMAVYPLARHGGAHGAEAGERLKVCDRLLAGGDPDGILARCYRDGPERQWSVAEVAERAKLPAEVVQQAFALLVELRISGGWAHDERTKLPASI